MNWTVALGLGFLSGAALGALVAWLHVSRKVAANAAQLAGKTERVGELEAQVKRLEVENRSLDQDRVASATIAKETEKRLAEEKALLEGAEKRLKEAFDSLAAGALQKSIEEFLRLATSKFNDLKSASSSELESKRKAVEDLLKPLREAIDKYQQVTTDLEKQRITEAGRTQQQLTGISQMQVALQAETQKLAEALRSNGARGRWGEITLQRIVELAGMTEHCDFVVQTGAQGVRPDLTVRLPANRQIAIDSKVPLKAYLESLEAATPELREAALSRHANAMKSHIDELSGKEYWKAVGGDFDLVVMFVPNDSFVAAAVAVDPTLVERAIEERVVIATPWTLIALLKAVALGWREVKIAENAQQISEAGRTLHERSANFVEALVAVGTGLDDAITAYNKAVGSFETRLLPAVRKLESLGARGSKELEQILQIDTVAKPPKPVPTDPKPA